MRYQKRIIIINSICFLFAIIFDWFFLNKKPGLSYIIFCLLLSGTMHFLDFFFKKKISIYTSCIMISMMILSFSFALSEQPFLKLFNHIFILLLLLLYIASRIIPWGKLMNNNIFTIIWNMLVEIVSSGLDNKKPTIVLDNKKNFLRIMSGFIISLPVMICVILLLMKADLVFSRYVGNFVKYIASFNFIDLLSHIFVITIAFFILSGISYILFFPENQQGILAKLRTTLSDQTIDNIVGFIVINSLNCIYLLFIFIQFTYLFGGEQNIVFTNFTYAEYTHRGFYELVAVAFINLSLLLYIYKYTNAKKTKRVFVILTSLFLLIINTFFIIYSAYIRISLYINSYGWTHLRFYVYAFIINIGILFLFILIALLMKKPLVIITKGIFVIVGMIYCICTIINIDDFIVERNFEIYKKSKRIDVNYLTSLSIDAIPALVRNIDTINTDEQKKQLILFLFNKTIELNKKDKPWQEYTWSYFLAKKTLVNKSFFDVYGPSSDDIHYWLQGYE